MYKNFSIHSHTPICWHKHLVLKSTLTYKHALKIWSVPPCIVCNRWAILNTHRISCFTALKQPHWPLISVLNWIELRFLWLCSKKSLHFHFKYCSKRKGRLNECIQTLHSPTPMPSLTSTVQCCSQHALQKECWQGSASSESLLTTCRHTPQCRDWGAWKKKTCHQI